MADSQKMGGILEALGYEQLQPPIFKTEKEEVKFIADDLISFYELLSSKGTKENES